MEGISTIFDSKVLGDLKKPQLVEIILELQKEKNSLKTQACDIDGITDRITEVERSHYLYLQYGRRSTVEITGIPAEVEQKDLENHVIAIWNEAKIQVHGKSLDHLDIEACHRIGKKNVVITRFVNRKFAREGLFNGKNLKGTKLYGNKPIYINDSFSKPFQYIGFVIRKLKSRSLIQGYKVRNGVFLLKKEANDNFVEISHKNDFLKYNVDIDTALA